MYSRMIIPAKEMHFSNACIQNDTANLIFICSFSNLLSVYYIPGMVLDKERGKEIISWFIIFARKHYL